MSLIKAIKQQLGLSVIPANNFTLDAAADNGTMKLARNNGQDIMTVAVDGGISIRGTATNNNAAYGFVGEFLTANRTVASAGALVSGTTRDVTSVLLGAGDWDVEGLVGLVTTASTNVTRIEGLISTSAIADTFGEGSINSINYIGGAVLNTPANGTPTIIAPKQRLSLSAPTTVYLDTTVYFTVAAAACFGTINARRVR